MADALAAAAAAALVKKEKKQWDHNGVSKLCHGLCGGVDLADSAKKVTPEDLRIYLMDMQDSAGYSVASSGVTQYKEFLACVKKGLGPINRPHHNDVMRQPTVKAAYHGMTLLSYSRHCT